ncbi:MAG TPA: YtxH domain-containing protein [Chloroflexota bacterium]|nr:YtxH domain-containing protein [Chloroflexota bacterium]
MSATNELHKLTDKAQEAEQKAADARHQAKADLEKAVQNSRASIEAHTTKMRESASASGQKASTWWGEQQLAWNAHVAKMRQSMDERKVKHAARAAEQEAEQAEADASFAIDFAYGAIEAAELAVLYAILAREDADEAAAVSAGSTR